jgi:hypothetical protein
MAPDAKTPSCIQGTARLELFVCRPSIKVSSPKTKQNEVVIRPFTEPRTSNERQMVRWARISAPVSLMIPITGRGPCLYQISLGVLVTFWSKNFDSFGT